MTTKGKFIVIGVAAVALGVVFISGGLGSDLASSAFRTARMRVVPPPNTILEITTFSPSTSEEITTSAPPQTACNESEIQRITQEVNALKGQEYLEAVIQEIVPNDSQLRNLGTAALRQYIISNVAYFKARLIQIRLSKICPEKNQGTEKNEDTVINISTTQSTQECVNSCVNSCF